MRFTNISSFTTGKITIDKLLKLEFAKKMYHRKFYLALLFLAVLCNCSSAIINSDTNDTESTLARCEKSGWSAYSVRRKDRDRLSAISVFTINAWFGRMGNNFLQIKHAVRYAVCCRAKLVIKPKNYYMPNLQYYLDFSRKGAYAQTSSYVKSKQCSISWEDPFFVDLTAFPLPSCTYDEYAALQYIVFGNEYPSGCPSSTFQCSPKLDDALVVHIRSGDIFGEVNLSSPTISMYAQPPVAFYEEIFSSRSWSRIQFITSLEKTATYNPVWRYYMDPKNLKKKVNLTVTAVQFQTSNDVLEVLPTLLCARYFVASSSKFSNMIIAMAPYLKEFFSMAKSVVRDCSVFQQRISQHGVTCNQLTLPGYNMAMNWTNSSRQRDFMLKYRVSSDSRKE